MEERTVYDETYECNHSYDKRCSTSYVTTYNAQQEEECEENFKKDCFIESSKFAYETVVEICKVPLVKDCDVEGRVLLLLSQNLLSFYVVHFQVSSQTKLLSH